MARSTEEHEARLAVLSIAVQELCRALTPSQAAQVAGALQTRVGQLPTMPGAADAAAAGEVGVLLTALGR